MGKGKSKGENVLTIMIEIKIQNILEINKNIESIHRNFSKT